MYIPFVVHALIAFLFGFGFFYRKKSKERMEFFFLFGGLSSILAGALAYISLKPFWMSAAIACTPVLAASVLCWLINKCHTRTITLSVISILLVGCVSKEPARSNASDVRLTAAVTVCDYGWGMCRFAVESQQHTTFVLTTKMEHPGFDSCETLCRPREGNIVISIVKRDDKIYWNSGNTLFPFD